MKKRRIMMATSMLLAVLIVAGGTFAWFTASTKPIKNDFKAGTLKFKTWECFDKRAALNVNPGDCIGKAAWFTNCGTKRMYIRVKVTPSLDESIVTMALNPGWVEHDGFYYYRYPVKPGWTTVPLMNRICFSGENMTNEHQGAEYTLTLQPEAVQTTNGAPFELWGVYPYTLGGNSNRSADPTIVPEDYGLSTEAAPVLDFEGEITGYDNE